MQYRPLADTGQRVSILCLGTMTFGEQNDEQQAFAQLDLALDAGINFIDTAEMYPVPPNQQTMGHTEAVIGRWLAARGCRDRITLATKVAGPGRDWLPYIRGGSNRLDRINIETAVDASLQRLQTDVIDIYQLHWPDRETNFFGQLGYAPARDPDETALLETLEALGDLVRAGKVRHIGISNETPWGVMRYLQLAAEHGLPRMVSIQNPYSLLNRTYEVGLAEISDRENIGLLAYSPLAFGVLTGKYLNGAQPVDARLTKFPAYDRYSSPQSQKATHDYVTLARDAGLSPGQMALAYVNSRPFLTSTIIGATTLEQLHENIGSADMTLDSGLLDQIETIHRRHPNPAP